MNVGTAHSEVNPNTRVMNSRGIWLSYVLGIGLLHVVLLSIPFFSVPWSGLSPTSSTTWGLWQVPETGKTSLGLGKIELAS
ncbi:hypothetical protein DUI87_21865 [Hirundo rustica rustica]|uniref:Uncharacterized protein n=1 Tax=Hirundo rustica rustica TaxID=333673 RepID=A0A3M0JK91_HIRRU|nr:hypothetical protein DUI87_21865 [Hirundo rustica rustica]